MIQSVSDKLDSLVQSLTAGPQRPAAEAPAPASGATAVPVAATAPQTPTKGGISGEALNAAVEKANEELQKADNRLSLAVDKDTNRVIIKYRDTQSGEVVRQIPAEAVLDMVRQLDKLKGMMFDSHG